MPWSGGGVFSRVHNWVTDKSNSIKVIASRMDAECDNFRQGIEAAFAKNGENAATADLDIGGFKLTNVDDGAEADDAATVGQLQSNTLIWADNSGSADALAGTYSPAVTTLTDGLLLGIRASGANTITNPTFSPNGLTARTIVRINGAALAVGDIAGDQHDLLLRYDLTNTRWNLLNSAGMALGRHTIPILASSMISRSTNGASDGVAETTTNKVMVLTKDFDATTQEFVQFYVPMPKSWNEGTITARFHWTATTGTAAQGVVWGIAGLARSDDDALDTAFGTAVEVTDAYIASNDVHISAETAAVTIGGTPAAQDIVVFQVYRDPADGADTKTGDAKLLAVELFLMYDAGTDS